MSWFARIKRLGDALESRCVVFALASEATRRLRALPFIIDMASMELESA